MQTRPRHVIGLAALALPALWLLWAGPERLLGLDTGPLGMALLVTAAWAGLLALSRLPRGEAETAIAPGEWKAWIGTALLLAAIVYLVGEVDVFAAATFDASSIRTVVRKLLPWLVVLVGVWRVIAARWKGTVQEDERDREIAARAAAWGRGALIGAVVAIAVMLAFSPPARLAWASHPMIASMLVLALLCGWLLEYAATAVIYWRDRRGWAD